MKWDFKRKVKRPKTTNRSKIERLIDRREARAFKRRFLCMSV